MILKSFNQKLRFRVFYFQSFLAFALLLSCVRSGGDQSADKENPPKVFSEPIKLDIEEIKKRGSLHAIVDNSSTSYFLYKGQPKGYEYELLELLAEALDVKLELTITSSIDEAIEMLNSGSGDIIAYSLTITRERKQWIDFTLGHYNVRQVLVQRKPDNWRSLTLDAIDRSMIRSQVDLIGKEVHVRKSSAYLSRLKNLSEEIGGDIIIVEEDDSGDTESLIQKVAMGEIDYTVADEDIAMLNATYFDILDVGTPVSFPQQIAWGVRKTSPELKNFIDDWLKNLKRTPIYNVVYNKYFKSKKAQHARVSSDFSSVGSGGFSPYDDLIKAAANDIGWDWRLLAAQIYQESKFDPKQESWAGAVGLLQLMPQTGKRFGAKNLYDPAESIKAGTAFIKYLDERWAKTIDDPEERIKFILASYNAGMGHIIDARNLAKKHGSSPVKWEGNVEKYLSLKNQPKYFQDPVVKHGYCRCSEPVHYVKTILRLYEQYQQLIPAS